MPGHQAPKGPLGDVGMWCHTIVRPVRRGAHLTAWLWLALPALGCGGSIPIITSKVEPPPYLDHDLAFLEPGSTDLAELTEELGPAAIVRRDGKLQVYAASVNQKRVVMAGNTSPFKHHYLVVELDNRDIVQRFEVVRPVSDPWFGSPDLPCTSWGVCILRDPWLYHGGFLSLGHEELAAYDDIAVVLDTGDGDALARTYLPGDSECAIYIYNALKSETWSSMEMATDESPWRYLPGGTYTWWTAPPGQYLIRAVYGPSCEASEIQELELDGQPAHSYYLSLAGKKCSKMSIVLESEATAKESLQSRRLVVR